MPEDDASYFRRRAIEEQAAAQLAKSDIARQRHDELCAMYRFRAAMLTRSPRCWTEDKEARQEPAERQPGREQPHPFVRFPPMAHASTSAAI